MSKKKRQIKEQQKSERQAARERRGASQAVPPAPPTRMWGAHGFVLSEPEIRDIEWVKTNCHWSEDEREWQRPTEPGCWDEVEVWEPKSLCLDNLDPDDDAWRRACNTHYEHRCGCWNDPAVPWEVTEIGGY